MSLVSIPVKIYDPNAYGVNPITPFALLPADLLNSIFKMIVRQEGHALKLAEVCRYWKRQLNTACQQMVQLLWDKVHKRYPKDFEQWRFVLEDQHRLSRQMPRGICSIKELQFPAWHGTPCESHPLTLRKVALFRESNLPVVMPPYHFLKQLDIVDSVTGRTCHTFEIQGRYAISKELALFRVVGNVIQGCHILTGQHQHEITGFHGIVRHIWTEGKQKLFFMTSNTEELKKYYNLYSFDLQQKKLQKYVFSQELNSDVNPTPLKNTFCIDGDQLWMAFYNERDKKSFLLQWSGVDHSDIVFPGPGIVLPDITIFDYRDLKFKLVVHNNFILENRYSTWNIYFGNQCLFRSIAALVLAPNSIIYLENNTMYPAKPLKVLDTQTGLVTNEWRYNWRADLPNGRGKIISMQLSSDSTVTILLSSFKGYILTTFDFVRGNVVNKQHIDIRPPDDFSYNGEQIAFAGWKKFPLNWDLYFTEFSPTPLFLTLGVLDFSAPCSDPPKKKVIRVLDDQPPRLGRISKKAQDVCFKGIEDSDQSHIIAGCYLLPLWALKKISAFIATKIMNICHKINSLACAAFEKIKSLVMRNL